MVNASPEGADSDVILQLLGQVSDPEVPVLSILDLGIVRSWQQDENGVEVVITPTYSGCPAMDTIEADIRKTFSEAGYSSLEVRTVLDPPWTTDWMSEEGKEKLRAYGIAPPESRSADKRTLFGKEEVVRCPHCRSLQTEVVSMFGSTACKALYRCKDCLEPFDYFKCI